jgi:phosphate transport system permease protein
MQDQPAFTGRKRRLTNRWSVWLSDRVAQAIITIGGVSTIAAVLLVFFLLVYVSLPLFTSAAVHEPQHAAVPSPGIVMQGIHDSGVLAWSLERTGRFVQCELATGELLSEAKLLSESEITTAMLLPDILDPEKRNAQDFCCGLQNGSLLIGEIAARVEFKRPAALTTAQLGMPRGTRVLFEKGILEHTVQDMYRWQSLSAKVVTTHALGEQAILDVDYFRDSSAASIVALNDQGQISLVNVAQQENVLTGETETTLETKAIPLPTEITEKPIKVRFLGRGNELAVLWKNGRLIRLAQLSAEQPVLVETVFVCQEGHALSSLVLQQGRYTLVVGDDHGQISTWHAGREESSPNAPSLFVKGHELPAMSHAITALNRSSNTRMIVAGSAAGEVATYHVTTERQLTNTPALPGHAVQLVTLAPNDNFLWARSATEAWTAKFQPQYPEVSLKTMFTPVVYEGYVHAQHKWQSTSGNTESEPKFGLIPLIFGTLKATFYSMLFGAPIALLAAVYTSEFIHPSYKAPVKSTVEMMSMIPSVVLGYLAGMVFAPFVEAVLPTILISFFVLPFCFLVGAQLWQLLPQKVSLLWAKTRLLFVGLTLLLGAGLALLLGPLAEQWLFAGSMKTWLMGDGGNGTGGWCLLLLPLVTLLIATGVNNYLNPFMREKCVSLSREKFALLNLCKFVVASCVTCLLAYGLAVLLAWCGLDSRGGIFDAYVQKNALVVGFVMGFAIVPIIYTISEDALSTVPQHLRSASLGCGATQWQTTWRVVIPTAASGLFSAVMVGFGRAIGETMIMLMATGNVPIMSTSVFNGFRSLSANLAEELPEAAQWGTHFRLLFFSGVILMVFTFIVNTSAELVRISFRRRAKQL